MDEWGEGGVQVRDANRGVLQHEVQTSVHTSTAWRRCLNYLDFVLFPSGTLGVSHPPPIPSSIGSQVFELPCSFSVMDSRNLSLSPPPFPPSFLSQVFELPCSFSVTDCRCLFTPIFSCPTVLHMPRHCTSLGMESAAPQGRV